MFDPVQPVNKSKPQDMHALGYLIPYKYLMWPGPLPW